MGEAQGSLFSLNFNPGLKVETRRDRVTADSGAVVLREVMDRLDYPALFAQLHDPRDPNRVTYSLPELLRTDLLGRSLGYDAHSHVRLLHLDPALRMAVSDRRGDRPLQQRRRARKAEGLTSQPTLSRALAALSLPENRRVLGDVMIESTERRMRSLGVLEELTLDMDSLPNEVHGSQPGSVYNGHYGIRCYHPIVVRTERGDYLGARLRPGNAHTAEGSCEFILPILRRVRGWAKRIWLRMDAGYPGAELLQALDGEDVRYVARIKRNAVLGRLAAEHLRTADEDGLKTFELAYQAVSWETERRVVLVIPNRNTEQHELLREHFFLLTNVPAAEVDAEALLGHYRQRGEAEKDFGDWQQAVPVRPCSTSRTKTHYRGRRLEGDFTTPDSFAANEARLLLSLIAANLLHAAAELLERQGKRRMSRESFRLLVLKAAGRVVLGARSATLIIDASRAQLWSRLMHALDRLHPARGSPKAQALPIAA